MLTVQINWEKTSGERCWLAVLETVIFRLAVAGHDLSTTRALTLFLSDVPRQMQALNVRD